MHSQAYSIRIGALNLCKFSTLSPTQRAPNKLLELCVVVVVYILCGRSMKNIKIHIMKLVVLPCEYQKFMIVSHFNWVTPNDIQPCNETEREMVTGATNWNTISYEVFEWSVCWCFCGCICLCEIHWNDIFLGVWCMKWSSSTMEAIILLFSSKA